MNPPPKKPTVTIVLCRWGVVLAALSDVALFAGQVAESVNTRHAWDFVKAFGYGLLLIVFLVEMGNRTIRTRRSARARQARSIAVSPMRAHSSSKPAPG